MLQNVLEPIPSNLPRKEKARINPRRPIIFHCENHKITSKMRHAKLNYVTEKGSICINLFPNYHSVQIKDSETLSFLLPAHTECVICKIVLCTQRRKLIINEQFSLREIQKEK
jgi:hypothetical protein